MRWVTPVATLAALALVVWACSDSSSQQKGELMLVLTTDVALPDSIDKVTVEVSSFGNVQFANDYEVGSGKLLIPASLGLVQGSDPAAPVKIRVLAKKLGKTKMLRELTTTIPGRLASVRVPIRWLCDDSAKETSPGQIESICPPGQTCIGGECRDSSYDSSDAGAYSEQEILGAQSSAGCVDVVACMNGAAPVTPDMTACTVPKPSGDPNKINVALVVDDDGFCNAARTSCFVMLDKDPLGLDGWQDVGTNIKLPNAVCRRITSGRVKGVVVTAGGCATKTANQYPCVSGGSSPTTDGGSCGQILVDCSHPGAGAMVGGGKCDCPQKWNLDGLLFTGTYACKENTTCVDTAAAEEFRYSQVCEKVHALEPGGAFAYDGTLCGDNLVWKGGDGTEDECGSLVILDKDHIINQSCYATTGAGCSSPVPPDRGVVPPKVPDPNTACTDPKLGSCANAYVRADAGLPTPQVTCP